MPVNFQLIIKNIIVGFLWKSLGHAFIEECIKRQKKNNNNWSSKKFLWKHIGPNRKTVFTTRNQSMNLIFFYKKKNGNANWREYVKNWGKEEAKFSKT